MRKFLSIACALLVFTFVGILIYLEDLVLPEFWSELAAGLMLLAIAILYWGFKPEINDLIRSKKPFDPRFDHVEAWLFYDPEISYEKGERHPKKNDPRNKLVCNTITKKAYYVDSFVWRMICDGRIRWHSEDDQDLKRWCRKMGYELVKKDARESHLLDLGD